MNKNTSPKKNIEDIYPLSPMQQGMLFHALLEPDSPTYNEQMFFKLRGTIDMERFKQALSNLIQRHAVLRTAFIYKKSEKLLQVVRKTVDLPLTLLDWQDLSADEQDRAFRRLLDEDRRRGFNLSKAPLLRIHLIRLNKERWQVLWSNHHIILDGWSNPVLLKELFFFYESAMRGGRVDLPPARPFKEYIVWLQKQDKEQATRYWKELLADVSAPTPFNVDRLPNPVTRADRYGKKSIRLTVEEAEQVRQMARRENVTINTVVQGAWSLLLHHYSREEKVIFGATVSGRPAQIPDVQNMVGLFINTLPMRVNLEGEKATNFWLREIQQQGLALRDYEYSALADVQKQSGVEGTLPLFESILVFENYPVEEEMGKQKTSLTLTDFAVYEQTNFPLTLLIAADRELIIDASYQPTRFTEEAIASMLQHMKNLILSLARNGTAPLRYHQLLSPPQAKEMIRHWNETETAYDAAEILPVRFERQAAATPGRTALVFEEERLSYSQFNRAVNRLAHHLIKMGVRPDDRIAVYMERSIELVLALYAIHKAGAAYVPIAPDNPRDRVLFMLEDSNARLLLCTAHHKDDALLRGQNILVVDRQALPEERDDNPPLHPEPQQAAYMIYTSGSTGRPKGTLVSHEAIRNRLQWMQDTFPLTEEDRILQKTPFTFDVSVWEFFWPLMYGATLVIARPGGHKDTAYLVEAIRDHQVTTIHFVPPMLQVFLEAWQVETCRSLKRVICSGEALPYDLKNRFFSKLNAELHNLYGPTEAAVDVTWYPCPVESPYALLPIGLPVANTRIYVLDERLNPVPVGVPGELFIAGVQLARGYHRRPGLTAEKFIADPYASVPGTRMYRTGDLVRRLPDGHIDYLSRIDFQLKIRGFRIELGEIEHHLAQLPQIREAVVTVYEPQAGNKQLAAYVIPASRAEIDPQGMRSALASRLPDYMIPVHIIPLEDFPLTPNGKVDRRALPKPGPVTDSPQTVVAPTNEIERTIHSIWQDILETDNISIHTDFFQLGGHSILATRLVTRFRQAFDVEIPLAALFEATTIARQALLVEMEQAMGNKPALPPLEPVSRNDRLPVSLPQQRLWFIDQFNPGTTAYNINLALRIHGPLEREILQQSIRLVVERHEILRTSFTNRDGTPYLTIHPEYRFELEFDQNTKPQRMTDLIRSATSEMAATVFDLSKLPLLRMKIIALGEEDYLLCGVIHHIISDGLSMGILIREVLQNYDALSRGENPQPPPLPFQYADYAHWQRQWLSGDILERHIGYWKEHIGLQPPVLELPTDFPRPAVQTFNGRQFDFELESGLTQALNRFSRENGVTLFMTLMTAWQILLHRYSRQHTILIGTPVTGRLLEEANALIGFFVNTLVIKGQYDSDTTLKEALMRIRRNVLEAHAHQSLPFEQLVDLLQPERDLSHPPLFQAAFILQNRQTTEPEISGLRFEEIVPDSVVAKVDISLYASETREGLRLRLEYNSDLFRENTIERMARHLSMLLSSMTANPAGRVSRLNFMPDEEQALLLSGARAAAQEDIPFSAVPRAFKAVAAGDPGHAALIMNERIVSYGELDTLSDSVAGKLINMGVTPGSLVGICMSRGPEMIIAMLAILKAGAAYLPLDPTYPAERLRYMTGDSNTTRILTNAETAAHSRAVFGEHISQYTLETLLDLKDTSQEMPEIHPQQTAYVIYTSGSTGKPKGTLLHHAGLLNLAREQKKAFHIDKESRILQFASLSFDAATWETFMALLNGATLILIDSETQASVEKLQEALVERNISTVTLPPSVLSLFDDRPMPGLRTIITAGEKCPQALVKRFQPGRQMVNAYGPTETTVCASLYETDAREEADPPIGYPLGGFDLHVLDEHLQLLPVGVPGELCIGGVGLAHGYLNRPDLTEEKFIAHPYGPPGARLYRSGDLVKRRDDGAIEFLGRIDHQVKLRGFRIELGEIQNSLLAIDEVQDAYVMVREDITGEQRLTAYIATAEELKSVALRKVLAEHLPEYMIPASFVFMKSLPLTSNGKVDRAALPVPEMDREQLSTEFVAPRNEQEETIAAIVRDLLHLEQVGIHDNFFELGGHSLLATRFVARLRDNLAVEVPLRLLFENPTIEGMARVLSGPDVRIIDKDEPLLEALDREQEDDDELLDSLDDLSEDELNALLNDSDGDEDEHE